MTVFDYLYRIMLYPGRRLSAYYDGDRSKAVDEGPICSTLFEFELCRTRIGSQEVGLGRIEEEKCHQIGSMCMETWKMEANELTRSLRRLSIET